MLRLLRVIAGILTINCRFMGSYKQGSKSYKTHVRRLITPLITSHEPPTKALREKVSPRPAALPSRDRSLPEPTATDAKNPGFGVYLEGSWVVVRVVICPLIWVRSITTH